MSDFANLDVGEVDGVLRAAASVGVDTDAAIGITLEANSWRYDPSWRLGSPVLAASLSTSLEDLWLNNHRGGREPAGLTTWGWLVGALYDVEWQPTWCTWTSQQVPLSSAMAHVASRVVGHPVTPGYLRRLYGHATIGSAAFALQLVAHEFRCGLCGPEQCCWGGPSHVCPLIDACVAYKRERFPYA